MESVEFIQGLDPIFSGPREGDEAGIAAGRGALRRPVILGIVGLDAIGRQEILHVENAYAFGIGGLERDPDGLADSLGGHARAEIGMAESIASGEGGALRGLVEERS